MAVILILALVVVLFLYGRSVAGMTRHALEELFRYLTLILGLLFIVALLILLTINSQP